jgi:hypothetical protein
MDTVLTAEPGSVEQAARTAADRRRPGRVDYHNNELIGLLRDPAAKPAGLPAEALSVGAGCDASDDDSLAAAKGIATAVVLSLGCWTAIAAGIWMVCHG